MSIVLCYQKLHGHWSQRDLGLSPAPPLPSHVTLGKRPNLSGLRGPHLYKAYTSWRSEWDDGVKDPTAEPLQGWVVQLDHQALCLVLPLNLRWPGANQWTSASVSSFEKWG